MSDNAPLPLPPTSDFLQWMTQRPDEFAAYLQRVYALSNLQFIVNVNGETRRFPIVFSGSNATVTLNLE